jgi:hypothetical protein
LFIVPTIFDHVVGYYSHNLDEAVGYCSHYFGSGCWLLVHIILDQAVGYCSHYFGSGCWSLFPSKIMGTVANGLIQNNGNSNQQPHPK